jgi:hypothetical protein
MRRWLAELRERQEDAPAGLSASVSTRMSRPLTMAGDTPPPNPVSRSTVAAAAGAAVVAAAAVIVGVRRSRAA